MRLDECQIANALIEQTLASKRALACSHQWSTGRPRIFPLGIRNSNIPFASLSTRWESDASVGPGLSRFSRIFLPFSSLSHVRANERNAALLAEGHTETRKTFHRSN